MKILFRGLGPKETVVYKGMTYRNGAAVDMDDAHAAAYLNAGIAFPAHSEVEIEAAQALEKKNAATRERIRKKAVEKEAEAKAGGEK